MAIASYVGKSGGRGGDVVTAAVIRGDLAVVVIERGELDSIKSVLVRCEVEGEKSKLIEIVPEGTRVGKDEVVARLDTDELKKQYDLQKVKWKTAEAKAASALGDLKVQQNKEQSEIDKARLAWDLAKIDLEKYEKREYQALYNKQKGLVELANKELKEAEENLEFTKNLVRKGFVPVEQLRIQELGVAEKKYKVSQGEDELGVLVEYDQKRKTTELKGKAKEAEDEYKRTKDSQKAATEKAKNEWDAADIMAKLEDVTLKRIDTQLARCVIKAPQDGIVVYFKRFYDEMARIQPGALLFFQQPIFTLPDLEHMKVKVKIHESVIKKIGPGQKATLIVDAIPNYPLTGTVKTVGTLAQSEGWRQTVKEYLVEIDIDDLPTSAGLKPGMTAETKIHVQTLHDTLMVPVQAVTEFEGRPVCYVGKSKNPERRSVEVGESNDQFIQIVSGLTEGEEVALDARSRAAAEVKAARK
ncbi:MAG TPA: efflux RND transporter periplasmic adaptor subunit [Gemmataceae bacterium]|nr:efflux RND transporter periplasmic adaptor subunit [Gemmataceae bacterium]